MPTAPYVLAITSGALVLFIAFVAEPAAERFKPIPPLAGAIDRGRHPDDVVAIRGVSGGNGLVFYTRPPVQMLGGEAQAYISTICPFADAWIVARPQDAPWLIAVARGLQRDASVVRETPDGPDPRAALVHVSGPPCPTDWLETPVNPKLPGASG
jgi:hypothetical protein